MTVSYTTLKSASYKALGLHPNWAAEVVYTESDTLPGPPTAASDGVDVSDAVVAQMRVKLREDPSAQKAWVEVTSVVNSTLYRITIDSVNYDYTSDASATEQEILDGLEAALPGAPVMVTQASIGGTNMLVLTATSTSTFTIAVSAELGHDVEATSATFTVWLRSRVQTEHDVAEGYETVTKTNNWTQRIECGGYDRLFIEPIVKDGRVITNAAPCLESEA